MSFMLFMDRKHDVDKLQRLQNRAMRLCYNINNPIDIGIVNLHEQTKVDMLCERRKLFLLCLMYDLRKDKTNNYEKSRTRATRARDGYVFKTVVPKHGLYLLKIALLSRCWFMARAALLYLECSFKGTI